MKKFSKFSLLNTSDDRPIPVPEENLYNNPDEENSLTFRPKPSRYSQKSKIQNNEK